MRAGSYGSFQPRFPIRNYEILIIGKANSRQCSRVPAVNDCVIHKLRKWSVAPAVFRASSLIVVCEAGISISYNSL